MRLWEMKLLKFWAQSHLLGVKKLKIGYRDQRGELLAVGDLDTEDIPKTVSGRAQKNHIDAIIDRKRRVHDLDLTEHPKRVPMTRQWLQEDPNPELGTWDSTASVGFMKTVLECRSDLSLNSLRRKRHLTFSCLNILTLLTVKGSVTR